MKTFVIAGGGYRGILGAILLRQKGHNVTLIDAGKGLGGVLNGIQWKGYSLDLGCHLFDNTSKQHTQLLQQILADKMQPIEVTYGGRTEGVWHDNFTVPSYANTHVDKAQLLHQLVIAAAESQPVSVHNYQSYLKQRYGNLAAQLLAKACRKKVQYDAKELDAVAARVVLFDRVNFFDNDTSLFLKQHAHLDEVLAASAVEDPMRFYPDAKEQFEYRNIYPPGGTGVFCQKAQSYLDEIGVKVVLNAEITNYNGDLVATSDGQTFSCDKLFWTLELEKAERLFTGQSTLARYIHPVPMVVAYFEVNEEDVNDYTYVHDHSDDTYIFRASTIGKYSQQIIDGKTYVCCEIPTTKESEIWQHSELFVDTIWQEFKLLNIVKENACYSDYKIINAPVTFKLPKIGFSETERTVRELLAEFPNLILTDTSYFSTQDIAQVVADELRDL